MKLIFLGPPGAGKGTQAGRISEKYGIAHISTGAILRTEVQNGTPLGMEAKAYMDRGDLVPDDLIIRMVQGRITAADCEKGYLFDGFPRTVAQAEALKQISDIDMVLNIDVPTDRLVARICGRRMCRSCGAVFHVGTYTAASCNKCGGELYLRDDDREETVQNRILVYNEKTQPLIAFYERFGLLKNIDGDKSPSEVRVQIEALLERIA